MLSGESIRRGVRTKLPHPYRDYYFLALVSFLDFFSVFALAFAAFFSCLAVFAAALVWVFDPAACDQAAGADSVMAIIAAKTTVMNLFIGVSPWLLNFVTVTEKCDDRVSLRRRY
jgi:hypothetical protein